MFNKNARIGRVYFGRTAKEYDQRRDDDQWRGEEKAFRELISELKQQETLGDTIRILDMPCGTGRWLPFLEDFGGVYYGVDISKDMISEAQQKASKISFETKFVESGWKDFSEYVPARFDLVICTRFLGHWNKHSVRKIIDTLAAKVGNSFILQVRVNNSILQRNCEKASILLSGPRTVRRKLKKSGRLTRSHDRNAIMKMLAEANLKVSKTIVVTKDRFSWFEYWLCQRQQKF